MHITLLSICALQLTVLSCCTVISLFLFVLPLVPLSFQLWFLPFQTFQILNNQLISPNLLIKSLLSYSWSFPRFVPMSTAQQQLNKLARRATLDSHNCDSELEPTESTSDSIILPELIGHSELLTQQRMYCVSIWLLF